jgi:hypothetical protein
MVRCAGSFIMTFCVLMQVYDVVAHFLFVFLIFFLIFFLSSTFISFSFFGNQRR